MLALWTRPGTVHRKAPHVLFPALLSIPLEPDGIGAAVQAAEAMAPLPAEPPIGGAVWTVVIPAVLLLGSFLGTYLLYRRFSREGGR